MRTILCKDDRGEFKIEVPDGAYLTFGADVPFEKNNGYQKHYALRVYSDKSKNKILATFCRVEWFRDLEMKMSRLIVREEGKSLWKSDEDGYEASQSVRRSQSWEDSTKMLGSGTTPPAKKTRK